MLLPRAAFALDPGVTFLNHGSFGARPWEVVRAAEDARMWAERRPIEAMEAFPAAVERVASRVARFVGADPRDVALVENATQGVATVLRALPLRAGDRLVTTSHVYGAVREALRYVATRSGAVVHEVAVPFPLAHPDEVLAAVRPALRGARLLVVDAITSPTGLLMPLAALVEAARAERVPVLVDAAHAPGHVPLALDGLGADFVTGNLHKWAFAPKGAAFLWAARRHHALLAPLAPSHDMARGFPRSLDWVGTRDVGPWLAVPAGLDVIGRLGEDEVFAYYERFGAEVAELLSDAWGEVLPAPSSMRRALVAVGAPGVPAMGARALQLALRAAGIEVPCIPFAGRAWVRVSAAVYVSRADVVRLADAVMRLTRRGR